MKLLISTGLFYPSKLGGPANTLYWLGKGLVSKGVIVSVVSLYKYIDDDRISPDKWTIIDNIKTLYCTATTKLAQNVILQSIKQIKKNEVLLLSSFHFMPCFFVALYASLLKKRIIWSPRGELFDSAINKNKFKKIYIRFIKLFFTKSVIFHATSNEEKEKLQYYLGKNIKTVIIPNYMELPEKEERNANEKYLLYVGRIAPIKALDNLIKGLMKSEKFIKSEYKFFLAGYTAGEYYESLLKIISENNLSEKIIFLGNVEGREKNTLYANACFSFLVSHSENFGNVVVESLAQGTPVVASKGTPWQMLNEINSGYWIENNVESIAKCVNVILQLDNENYEAMRENAFNCCQEHFDVYKNIDKWLNIINPKVNV